MDTGHICAVCEEVIYNPICAKCLVKETLCWLGEQKPSLELLEEFLDEVYVVLTILRAQQTVIHCTICKQLVPAPIDPYCFTKAIFDIIKKLDNSLAHKFLQYFNFDFEQTTYTNTKYEF